MKDKLKTYKFDIHGSVQHPIIFIILQQDIRCLPIQI